MTIPRHFAFAPLVIVTAAALTPAGSSAQQQQACSTTISNQSCGETVIVGDPKNPCIEHDGKAYCPVVSTYYPIVLA